MKLNNNYLSVFGFFIILGILGSGLFIRSGWSWLLVLGLMILFVMLIGVVIKKRPDGIFINERNKMTLARFQMIIWTLIVLSAFVTIALQRIVNNASDPFAIAVPQQLWELLGISVAGLVGSPLLLSTKIHKKPTEDAIDRAAEAAVPEETVNLTEIRDARASKNATFMATTIDKSPQFKAERALVENKSKVFGILDANEKPEDASFSDIFKGDEIENGEYIDVAKVQMFFFTILIAVSYGVLLLKLMFAGPATISSFPELTDGLVALLGISAAGYLTSKTVDRTPSEKK